MTPTDLPVFPGERPARCPFAPPAEYARWREQERLQRVDWNGHTMWTVNRYDDVRAALRNPQLSAEVLGVFQARAHQDGPDAPQVLPRMDDPEHGRLRRMLTKDFTLRRVEAMRPEIEAMAGEFIDTMVAKGSPSDLVAEYALPLPTLVISLLLGVPYRDHDFFQSITVKLTKVGVPADERARASREFLAYMMDLVARKEREPGDDLMSRMVHDHVHTGELRRETAAMNGLVLINAGHETTANMISLATVALLENPEQAAVLRTTDDPAVVATAVEELLRYLTIVHNLVFRVATEDVTIAGTSVKAGEGLIINLPAGNWDPAFTADPHILDITRPARGHLAFGDGVHRCLGQNLARTELQIALPTLLRRLPHLRLAVPIEEIPFRNDMSIYGVHSLPVAW